MSGHRIGYVLKVYPRFSETFVVTEVLAREAQGEDLTIFALRHSTDPRFHPEPARVQAPVHHVERPERASAGWAVLARAAEVVPGFGPRFAALLPELAGTEASEVHQGVALATRVVEQGITHLHAHFATLAAHVAEIASRLTGVPFSVTTHAKDIFHESVDPARLRRTLERAEHVVAISEYNRRHLASAFPAHAHRLRLVRNGLELARFPYRDPAPVGETLRVVAVGRLVEKKGFDRLVRAAARYREQGGRLSVTVAGGGELEGPLRALVAELGAGDVVDLVGPRTQAEVGRLLRAADVFAAPCTVGADGNADGLPTVLLEAMAMGVPVIASDVTGIPEVVRNAAPRTGVLVPADDDDALLGALAAVADPGFDRVGAARAARALVTRDYDSTGQAAALQALLPPPVPDRAEPDPARGPVRHAARPPGGPEPAAAPGPDPRARPGPCPSRRPRPRTRPPPRRSRPLMRLAYVCADPGVPVFGTKGASVHVQEILRAWRARGAEVRLYATRVGDDVPADLADVPVVHVPVPAAPASAAPGRAARVAARERAQADAARRITERVVADGADAVHERHSLFSTALAGITGALGVPGVLEVNSPLIDEQRTHRDLVDGAAARAALAAQVAAAERTACVSEPVARWVERTVADTGGPAGRVLVAPNGVNVERIRPCRDSAARGPDPVSPVVVFVGTLKPWHGVEHLIRARAEAAADWRLRVVGDGPQRASLEELAAELGVDAEFTGAVPPAAVPGLLADCAVAVAPYPATEDAADQYFSPLKIYEYAAAALPVVASRVGQVPAAVEDGVTGLLVAPSDPTALAGAVDALVADPGRRRALGRAGRRDAVARHSWTAVLDGILAGTDLAPPDPTGTRPRSGAAPRPAAPGALQGAPR